MKRLLLGVSLVVGIGALCAVPATPLTVAPLRHLRSYPAILKEHDLLFRCLCL